MASTEKIAIPSSEPDHVVQIPLSTDYVKKLDVKVRERYLWKISTIGIDPILIDGKRFEPDCLQSVESTDLLFAIWFSRLAIKRKNNLKPSAVSRPTIKWCRALFATFKDNQKRIFVVNMAVGRVSWSSGIFRVMPAEFASYLQRIFSPLRKRLPVTHRVYGFVAITTQNAAASSNFDIFAACLTRRHSISPIPRKGFTSSRT